MSSRGDLLGCLLSLKDGEELTFSRDNQRGLLKISKRIGNVDIARYVSDASLKISVSPQEFLVDQIEMLLLPPMITLTDQTIKARSDA